MWLIIFTRQHFRVDSHRFTGSQWVFYLLDCINSCLKSLDDFYTQTKRCTFICHFNLKLPQLLLLYIIISWSSIFFFLLLIPKLRTKETERKRKGKKKHNHIWPYRERWCKKKLLNLYFVTYCAILENHNNITGDLLYNITQHIYIYIYIVQEAHIIISIKKQGQCWGKKMFV